MSRDKPDKENSRLHLLIPPFDGGMQYVGSG